MAQPSNNQRTLTLAIDPCDPAPGTLAVAADALRAGLLVAFPTETVYGLGANARDARAVAQIFAAKGRPSSDPLIVHVADAAEVAGVALDIPDVARALAARFWPGPLTLVLRRRPEIPASVSAGLDTVAVRVPAHPVARALISLAGVPVAAPSANRFSRPSPTTAQHVLDDLDGRVAVLLDGGPAAIGLESTVVDLTGGRAAVLRPGGVPVEELREILPEIVFRPRYLAADQAAPAPGAMLKHYSPSAELRLVGGATEAVLGYIRAEGERQAAAGRSVAVLAASEDLPALEGGAARVLALGSAADLAAVGQALFARIREADALGVDLILVRGMPREGLGLAIWDRLVRAAEGRVVEVT